MTIRPLITVLCTASLVLAVLSSAGADEQKKTAALAAAEQFLQTIDGGDYAGSWDQTADLFRGQVSREMWKRQLAGLLPLFGKVIGRKLIDSQYLTQLPGAPDGEYVVIRYTTSYEKKQQAVETVTPMLDHDGQWRVSGYYIK